MGKENHVAWFSGKAFIVTGGSSGIGLAISKHLAEEGAKVIAISHDPNEFPIAKSQLEPNESNIQFIKCDITSAADREALKKLVTNMDISLTGLINNAGISTFGPFFETSPSALQKNIEVNFTGAILFTRAIFPLILDNADAETKYLGLMSSTSAKAPMGLIGTYPATKAGVEMLFRTLELELPTDVKILAVRAGPVKTNLYSNSKSASGFNIKTLEKYGERVFLEPEKVASVFVRAIRRKKSGIKYASFGSRMMVALTKGRGFGKIMTKGLTYLNRVKNKKRNDSSEL